MISGVHQVVLEVEDQDRALDFWTQTMGFELSRDTPYGDERWLEVRTLDKAVSMVLSLRDGERPTALGVVPTSNVFFYCDDLPRRTRSCVHAASSFPNRPPSSHSVGGRCSRIPREIGLRSRRASSSKLQKEERR
jgi:catechol 2,3-dioxygenase-like lactoylglutathione lyase family enzyme